MASPSQNFTGRLYHGTTPPLSARVAGQIYALAVATFFAAALAFQHPALAVVAQIIAFIALPLAAGHLHGASWRDLGLARPPIGAIAGALAIGSGLWLVSLHIAVPIIEATGRDRAMRQFSQQLLPAGTPLPWILAAYALVPGVCEELLHRGLLLGALVPRFGRGAALAVTTALFALIHLEPARIASTAVLGVTAGTIALWARSVWPAIVLHVVNNAIALLIAASGAAGWAGALAARPALALGAALGLCSGGLLLSWRCRRQSDQSLVSAMTG